jgi:5-(carboxyamino)imidazole ribonucleotide synthase
VTIGVLGGGQLGRMLALGGAPLGQRFLFVDPSRESCAAHVGELLVGPYDDEKTLTELARRSQVVTFEFENVDLGAARYLAELVPVFPPQRALAISQDRLAEKTFFSELAIPTPAYRPVASRAELDAAAAALGLPFVLKTRRFGYDGKGQFVVRTPTDVDVAWTTLGAFPLIAEAFVPFNREVSVIGARRPGGETAIFPLFENVHQGGVLRQSRLRQGDPMQHAAEALLQRALVELDYVGVLTLELFECNGDLLANEMAPRVHNSGHLTIEGCATSQFAMHVRAILDLSLGSVTPTAHVGMLNILGAPPPLPRLLAMPGAHVHLYGKTPVSGRKCGHITVVANSEVELTTRLAAAAALLAGGDASTAS